MEFPGINDDLMKAQLKRLIKIIEIQKSFLKRQEKLQKTYEDFIAVYKKYQKICVEELKMEIEIEKQLSLPKKSISDVSSVHDNIEGNVYEVAIDDRTNNDSHFSTGYDVMVTEIKNLESNITEQMIDLKELTHESTNIDSINHGYKMMLKDQHFKLTTLQEKLLKKLADITKLIKMLSDSTSESKRSNLVTCLAYIFGIDLPNGTYENVDDSVTVNFFQSISQLKWSIEIIDVEQVGDIMQMFDLLIEQNDITEELLDQQNHLIFMEHLHYFPDHVLTEHWEDFEDQKSDDDKTYVNIENIEKVRDGEDEHKSRRLKLQVELVYEQHLQLAKPHEPTKKNYNDDVIDDNNKYLVKTGKKENEQKMLTSAFRYIENKSTPNFGFFFSHGPSEKLNTVNEITSENNVETPSMTPQKKFTISKRSANPPKTIPVATVKPLPKEEPIIASSSKETNENLMASTKRTDMHSKFPDFSCNVDPFVNNDFQYKQTNSLPTTNPSLATNNNDFQYNRTNSLPTTNLPIATNNNDFQYDRTNSLSTTNLPIVTNNNDFQYNRTYSLPTTNPSISTNNNDFQYNRTNSFPATNNKHKKLCRLSQSFSYKSKTPENIDNNGKSSSLPTNFKPSTSTFIDWQNVQIEGEKEKTAEFRIDNKNLLSVQMQPRKLSFKRRNSGRNFVNVKAL